jgi:serine/threonine protein kinase
VGERQFGPYRLVRQIAVGGMAEIHLAKTRGIAGFEKYVALKMIHPNFAEDEQFIQMLVDEAKIAVQLNHGNIAQTFDLGRVGETYYITMEYVDGADLYKLLRRGSEQDFELPLDVCAYVAKEISSALDHAHRKRDSFGKPLGIVHRDVSPQNVLVSFSGEVKLVDFGIAKATMKARQTAVGVIKGKYYYMSPEQAWGDPIDHRSDIFSAGIVLYEMMTGQMLYLEEDLQRLLDMARKANIKPPSTLRRGIPPQLERIVMRALARKKEDRYQSAGELASDLQRFLHAYSPVITATKLAGVIKQVIGSPEEVSDLDDVEVRDGPSATHTLSAEDLIHDKDEIRDENSVIFRMNELAKQAQPKAPKVTRPIEVPKTSTPRAPSPSPPLVPKVAPQPRAPAKPRMSDEDTRQVARAPSGGADLEVTDLKPPRAVWSDNEATHGLGDGLDNIDERTVVSPFSGAGFPIEEGVEATVVTDQPTLVADPAPEQPESDDDNEDGETLVGKKRVRRAEDETIDEDVEPTIDRALVEPRKLKISARNAAPPAALAAKIQSPAVSELRKPRMSRKTPASPLPVRGNVLQQIVGLGPNAPMPVPPPTVRRADDTNATTLPAAPILPQPLQPQQPPYGYFPQQQYPQMTPAALHQVQPFGATPQPTSLSAQVRMFEVDEIPSQYKVRGPRGLKLAIAGVIAVSLAAGVSFFIVRATSESSTPTVGSIHVESVPPGAEVRYDGTRLAGVTPMTVDSVPVGTRHEIRVDLARHAPHLESVEVPRTGGEQSITAVMVPITGKLVINTNPGGADIYIDGQPRGRTPTTISDIDISTAKKLEIRLKDYRPYLQDLEWPVSGEITIDRRLER